MNYVNINEKITDIADVRLPIDNGAFRYGYGLFESMLVRKGKIRLLQYHCERLLAGMRQLYFEIPEQMTQEWLEEQVMKTVKKNRLERLCRVRLQIYTVGDGPYGIESNQPGFLIECFLVPQDASDLNVNGLVAGLATGLGKSMDALSNLKSCNALIYAVAARQAQTNKWHDALICNTSGNIIESTIANIFWTSKGAIYTPPLTDGCVAGVIRRCITEKVQVTEKSLSVSDLLAADEVFLTNAIKMVRWVGKIDAKQYNNEITAEIHGVLRSL